MAIPSETPERAQELPSYRRFLAIAAAVYLAWWFAVELMLPGSFNPLPGRLLVVVYFVAVWATSFSSAFVRRHVRAFFIAGLWLLTAHYFYLFDGNNGDVNWVIGSYVTVIALCLCLFSNTALLAYTLFVLVIAAAHLIWIPHLRHSVFLPGLVTIFLQANFGLRSKLKTVARLNESNELFQLLFNSTFEGVMVHENLKMIRVNDAFASMLGYEKSDLIGKDVLTIVREDQRALVKERLSANDGKPYEMIGITKQGRAMEIEVRAKDFVYHERPARLVTIQAISDRKRAEREQVIAQSMAENVRIRDEFISIASHELKTPLSTLKLQAQLIAQDVKLGRPTLDTADRIGEFVALINRQTNRLSELVDSMLDVSRISMGRLSLEFTDIDLAKLVRDCVAAMHAAAAAAGVTLTVEAPPGLRAQGDLHRLEQVFDNLLSNAIKYGERRPVKITVRGEDATAVVEISDQGLGVAPEALDRIFNRFERAVSSRNISGLGLGLYITRQIIEAHHGSVAVKSAPGAGSTFTVRLPIDQLGAHPAMHR